MTDDEKTKLQELLKKLKKKKDPNSMAIGDEVETKLIKEGDNTPPSPLQRGERGVSPSPEGNKIKEEEKDEQTQENK
jgi:hypothetical protein